MSYQREEIMNYFLGVLFIFMFMVLNTFDNVFNCPETSCNKYHKYTGPSIKHKSGFFYPSCARKNQCHI
jgi:hypothetical protein